MGHWCAKPTWKRPALSSCLGDKGCHCPCWPLEPGASSGLSSSPSIPQGKQGSLGCCSLSALLRSHIAALLNIDSFPRPVFCSIISLSSAFVIPGLAGNSEAVFCLPAFLPRAREGAPSQAESHQEITLGWVCSRGMSFSSRGSSSHPGAPWASSIPSPSHLHLCILF